MLKRMRHCCTKTTETKQVSAHVLYIITVSESPIKPMNLVHAYDIILVGNVSAAALVKTPHAKSVLDAGWSAFRTMLRYKCDFAGSTFAEVDEAFSTQTCSACDSRSGPKGIAGLGIREWTFSECVTVHDRKVNAAKNILAAGRRRLAEGIPAL